MNECLICHIEMVIQLDLEFLASFKRLYPVMICDKCSQRFQSLQKALTCGQCGRLQDDDSICDDCKKWQEIYGEDVVINQSFFSYNEAMHDYFQQFKRYGDYRLSKVFSSQIADLLTKNPVDAYIFVPTAESHLKERQFDPSIALFGNLVKETVRLSNILEVDHQSLKNRRERLATSQTFYLAPKDACKLKKLNSILILDDIYTTGATIYRMREAIRNQGVRATLKSLTLAR